LKKDIMNNIILIEAALNDAKIIFDLSNEEFVRQNSINPKPIEWESHLKWLKSKLNDPNYKLFLFFSDNKFIGQVKFEIENVDAIVSISIHHVFRGKGLSSVILKLAIEYLFEKESGVSNIVALIRPDNQPSIKGFSKVGFSPCGEKILGQEMFLNYVLNKKNYAN